MISKIWNIAHFDGMFVLSFNQPFLDLLNSILKNRVALKFCYRNKISVVTADRDDACLIADSVEEALNNGLRDGAMSKFYERLSNQLQYISSNKVKYEEWEKKHHPSSFNHSPKINYDKASNIKSKSNQPLRKFF